MKFTELISPEQFDKHMFPKVQRDATYDQATKMMPEMSPYFEVIEKHWRAGHIDLETWMQYSAAFLGLAIALEEIDGRMPAVTGDV